MEYNKNRFQKINDKKVLHKVKKQWVVLSLSMLTLLGGGAVVTKASAHADVNSQNNHTMRLSSVKGQINHNLVQAYRANQASSTQSNSNRSNNSANSQLNVNDITQRAGELHNRIVNNAEWNDLQKPSVGVANSENGRTKPNLSSANKPMVTNNDVKNQSATNSRINKPVNKVVANNNQNNGANNKPKTNPAVKSTKATTKRRPNLKALRGSLRMNRSRRLLGAVRVTRSNMKPDLSIMKQGNSKYVWSDGRWGTAHAIANGNTHTIYVYGTDNNSDTVGQTYVAYNYYQGLKDNDYGNSKFALAPNPSIFGNLFFQKEDKYGHITNNLPESPDNHSKNDWSIDVYDVKAPVNASELFSGVGAQYFPHGNDIQTAIKSINVQGLDTSDTTNMSDMFDDVNGNSFDGYSNDNVLTSISGLSDLDTSKVTDFKNMFQNNANLKSLDLGAFDTLNANKTGKTNVIPENVNQLTLGPKTMLASDSIANVKGPWGSTSTDANTYRNVNHQFWLNSNNTSGITKLTDGQSHPGTWNWNNIYWTDGRWGNAHVTVNGRTDKIIVSDGKGSNGSDVGETKDLSGSYLAKGNSNFFANVYFPSENSNGHITKLPNDKKDWQIIIKSGKAPKDSSYLFSGPKTYYYTNSITPQIKSIDVGGLDTSNVNDMHDMFNGVNANSGNGQNNDSALTSVTGLDHLNTSNVSDFTDIFQNDPGLTSLDLNNWDTTHATKKANMIPENVTKLTLGNHTILADNSIANVKNGWDSASDDTGTNNNGDHQYWKQNSNDSKYTRLTNNQSHPGTWTWKDAHAYWNDGRWGKAHVIIDGYSDKIIVSDNKGQQNGSDVGETVNNSGVYLSPGNPNFFANVFFPDEDSNGHITSLPNKNRDWQIIVKKGVNAPSDSSYLFSGPHAYWFKDGAYITPQIKSIDVGGLNTANVTNMESMFNNVNAVSSDSADNTGTLTSITGTSDWNTSKVTNFINMFQHNPNLKSLDLSNWDTTGSAYGSPDNKNNPITNQSNNFSHVNWDGYYGTDNRINMIPTNVTTLKLGNNTKLAWDSIADIKQSAPWNFGYLNDSTANAEELPNNGNHWWWHTASDQKNDNLTQETSVPGTWYLDDPDQVPNAWIWGDALVNIDSNKHAINITDGSTGGMKNTSDSPSDRISIFQNIRDANDPSKVLTELPGSDNNWSINMHGTRIVHQYGFASDLFNGSDGTKLSSRIQKIDLGSDGSLPAMRLDPDVTGANRTFSGLQNVDSLNLKGLNFGNLEYASYLMDNDPSLVNINLANLNINLHYLHHMFNNDTSLESINLGDLSTSKSSDYSAMDMFDGDDRLKRFAVSSNAKFTKRNNGNPQAWGAFFNPDSSHCVVNNNGNVVDIQSILTNGSEGQGSDQGNTPDKRGDYDYYLVSTLPVYWAPNKSDASINAREIGVNKYDRSEKYPSTNYSDTKNVQTTPVVVLPEANNASTGGSDHDNFHKYNGQDYNYENIQLQDGVIPQANIKYVGGKPTNVDLGADNTPLGAIKSGFYYKTPVYPAGYSLSKTQDYARQGKNGRYYIYADLDGNKVTNSDVYYTSDGEGDNHTVAVHPEQIAYVGQRTQWLPNIGASSGLNCGGNSYDINYDDSGLPLRGYQVVQNGQDVHSDSTNLEPIVHSELSSGNQNMLDKLGNWVKPFRVKVTGTRELVPINFIGINPNDESGHYYDPTNPSFRAYALAPQVDVQMQRDAMSDILNKVHVNQPLLGADLSKDEKSDLTSDVSQLNDLYNQLASSKSQHNNSTRFNKVINDVRDNKPITSSDVSSIQDLRSYTANLYQSTIPGLRNKIKTLDQALMDLKANSLKASDISRLSDYYDNSIKNNQSFNDALNDIKSGQPVPASDLDVVNDLGFSGIAHYQAQIHNIISNPSDQDTICSSDQINKLRLKGELSDDELSTGSSYSLDPSDWVRNYNPNYMLSDYQPILNNLSDTNRTLSAYSDEYGSNPADNGRWYDTLTNLMKYGGKYMGKIHVTNTPNKGIDINPIVYVYNSAKENATINYYYRNGKNNKQLIASKRYSDQSVGSKIQVPSDTSEADNEGLIYGYKLVPGSAQYGSNPAEATPSDRNTPYQSDGHTYIKVMLTKPASANDPNVINMYVTPRTEHIPISYVNDQNSGQNVKSFNIDGVDSLGDYDGNKSTDTPLYPGTHVKIYRQQLMSMIPTGYVLDSDYYTRNQIPFSDQVFNIVNGELPGDIQAGNVQDNTGFTVPYDVHIIPSPKPSDQYLTVNYIDQAGNVISSQKSKYNIIPIKQSNGTSRYSDQPLDITKIQNSEYNKLINSDKYVPEKDQQLVIPYGTPSVNIYLNGPKEVAQAPVTIRFLDANGREIQSDQYTHVALNGHAGDTGVIFNTTSDFTYNVPAGYKLQNPNEDYQASITSKSPYYKWNSNYAGTGRSTDWDSVHDQPLLLYKNNNVCISSLILRYVNQDGHQVGNTDIINQDVGTKVDVTNPNDGGESVPEGYQLAKTPYNQPVNYTVNNKDKVITLKVVGNQVTKPFTVTTESKGVDGNLLMNRYSDQKISGRIGDDITVNPEDYRLSSDYNCDSDDYGHSIHIDSDGSLSPDQLTFKYYENPDKAAAGNVIVHYINQKGRQVGNTFTINAAVNHYHTGQFVSDIAKATGYEAVPDGYTVSNPDSDATTITDQPQTMNIQVKGNQLTKSDSAVVVHRRIKQLNGTFTPLSDRTLSLSGDQYGDSDTIDPYDYVPSSETGVQYIVDSDDHTDNFVINPHQPIPPITFTYDPFGVSKVTVHYVDDSNSDQEIDQESDVGVVGDDFDIAPYMNDIPEGYQYNNQVTGSGSSLINPNEAIQFTGNSKDIYVHVKSNQDYPNDQPNDQSHHDWNGLNGSNGTGINPNND